MCFFLQNKANIFKVKFMSVYIFNLCTLLQFVKNNGIYRVDIEWSRYTGKIYTGRDLRSTGGHNNIVAQKKSA